MIVNRDCQRFLRVLLANALQTELALDVRRLRDVNARFLLPGLGRKLFIQHLFAQDHTIIADIDARTCDKLFDFGVGFAAKTAQRDIRRARHAVYSFLSARLVARSASPGISLRDRTTSSTN